MEVESKLRASITLARGIKHSTLTAHDSTLEIRTADPDYWAQGSDARDAEENLCRCDSAIFRNEDGGDPFRCCAGSDTRADYATSTINCPSMGLKNYGE